MNETLKQSQPGEAGEFAMLAAAQAETEAMLTAAEAQGAALDDVHLADIERAAKGAIVESAHPRHLLRNTIAGFAGSLVVVAAARRAVHH